MICPFKFSHYEFEGGQDCIGTECGMFKRCNADSATNRTIRKQNKKYRNKIAELQKKVDELTEQRDRWRSNWTERNIAYSELADEHQELEAKVDELTSELTAARNAHAQAEHEAVILREKLGRMLDNAHEISRIGGDC